MYNTHFSIGHVGGNWLHVKTLDYCYPYSLVLIEYNVGYGNKRHYAYIGYDTSGRFYIKTKNMIHNVAQEMIIDETGRTTRFINKWKDK